MFKVIPIGSKKTIDKRILQINRAHHMNDMVRQRKEEQKKAEETIKMFYELGRGIRNVTSNRRREIVAKFDQIIH